MADAQGSSKHVGTIIGVVLVVGAVISIFLIDWKNDLPQSTPPIRPLKTVVVAVPFTSMVGKYPGKVRANQEVDLAFQVSGPLVELPIKKGQVIEAGQLLARIDSRDFEHALEAKTAMQTKAKSDLEKITQLLARDASTEKELIDATASFQVADAEMKIAAKALEDTNLRAPFSGVIANTFVENFQNVNAKDPILSLQDVTSVEIELYIPEQRMALSAKIKGSKVDLVATFDFLPGRKFAVEVSEFATETDPKTQTYLVTVVMLAPEDVTILPGMTATILAYPKQTEAMAEAGFAVPVDATGVDGVGQYFVWRVDEAPDGTGTVHRVNVQVGQMMQDQILIVGGLEKGDRIAASGIHVLQESQQIRLLGNGPGERTQ